LVHVALADAGIACWDAKFTYNFWRPITSIPYADDGNPATVPDPAWEPLLITPSFPEYVSGHSTFSGAAGEVLRRWFRRDKLKFSIESDTVPGVTRRFGSLNAAVEEIGMSRIWGGIHFHAADADGQALGRKVGDWVFDHSLQVK
jgi:membrane-associated phospholipid phosphatase